MDLEHEQVGETAQGNENTAELPKLFEGDEEKTQVHALAVKALAQSSSDTPKKTEELISEISQANGAKEYVIYQILLQASKEDDSPISSRKGRGGGYFLSPVLPDEEARLGEGVVPETQPTPSSDAALQTPETTEEKHIWPLNSEWLRLGKGIAHCSADFAHVKAGGIWGNPDVVGLKPYEKLGFFDVDVTTVEVKASAAGWRYFFFEAVAHKRFSNRVYYAYRSESGSEKDNHEMLSYAERYNTGVIRVDLSDDDYAKLTNWHGLADTEKARILDLVVEVVPAPYEAIPIAEKIAFLERLGITEKSQLYGFGR